MTSLSELAQGQADLTPDDVDWLHLLLGDWQLLADLSFADLVLWLPLRDGARGRLRRGRPDAADHRADRLPRRHRRHRGTARAAGPSSTPRSTSVRICRERDPDWPGNVPVREETIPVVRDGRVIAVVSRHTNLAAARTPSRLELTYLRTRRRPGPDDRRRAASRSPAPTRLSGGVGRASATG